VNNKEWVVDVMDLNLDDSPIFLLWLNYTGSSPSGFTSPYFNITREAVSTSSSSTTKPTSTSTSTSTASSSTQARSDSPTAQSAASNNGDPNSGGLSDSAKVGLGVGIGIGMPLLICFGILIGLQVRRHRKIEQSPVIPTYYHQHHEKMDYSPHMEVTEIYEAPDAYHMPGAKYNPAELDSTSQP